MREIAGIPASDGVAIGPAFLYKVDLPEIPVRNDADAEDELRRFNEASAAVSRRLTEIEQEKEGFFTAEDFEILEVQRMLLEDDEYGGVIHSVIREQSLNVEAAVDLVTKNLAREFSEVEDEYFSQRANDIRDIGGRLLRHLFQIGDVDLSHVEYPVIVFAHDLAPSDTISFDLSKILGLCTEIGSATSHTAILARSLGVPAVVGVGTQKLSNNELSIIDGGDGTVIIDPDEKTRDRYEQRRQDFNQKRNELLRNARDVVKTRDGRQLEVVANIGSVIEAGRAVEFGAEGIGLLRTEFLFLERRHLPSESEQYEIYRKIADLFGERPVVVRTLDIGGDKQLPSVHLPEEPNPFLGHRAIRLCLEKTELFRTQLRALLRAGFERNVLIMFPFISTVPELKQALEQLETAKAELRDSGAQFNPDTRVGIMVEIPSTAILADKFAPYVQFFSIGTNDLCQYTLAADRTNEKVAGHASPFDPSILRLIKMSIEAAHKNGIWVGLCGEMAGDPVALPLLLGLGVDEFSMAPASIPEAKNCLRGLSMELCRGLAERCLEFESAAQARELLEQVRDGLVSHDAIG